MNSHTARWAYAVLAVVGLGAFGLVDREFDARNPLFYLGLTLIVVTAVSYNGVSGATRARNLNDEFETGYRVGYRAGRRAALRSVPHADIPIVTQIPRKQEENDKWPDTGDFPRGNTKPQ